MDEGTSLFAEGLSQLGAGDHDRPTPLADWNTAQLIAHVNSNARALVNLATWARTGVESPMYQNNDQRARDIDEGAKQSLQFLIEDFGSASQEFSSAIKSLTPEQLDFKVKSARGRDIPASEAVWIRIREVWIHAVDLAVGITFSRFSEPLLSALLDDVVASLGAREGTPGLQLIAVDTTKSWSTARGEKGARVAGDESELLAWLVGRSKGEGLSFDAPGGVAPALPAWL